MYWPPCLLIVIYRTVVQYTLSYSTTLCVVGADTSSSLWNASFNTLGEIISPLYVWQDALYSTCMEEPIHFNIDHPRHTTVSCYTFNARIQGNATVQGCPWSLVKLNCVDDDCDDKILYPLTGYMDRQPGGMEPIS